MSSTDTKPRTNDEQTADSVVAELKAMRLLGMRVPAKAITMAQDPANVAEYRANGMKISEIADLMISLASVR